MTEDILQQAVNLIKEFKQLQIEGLSISKEIDKLNKGIDQVRDRQHRFINHLIKTRERVEQLLDVLPEVRNDLD